MIAVAPEPVAPQPDTGAEPLVAPDLLFGFWYRALPSRKVRPACMAKVTLLGLALVVGRDTQGHPFALHDACPHRGKPLSYGWFDGETLQCSFHGWSFEPRTGQCRFVPSCTAAQQARIGNLRAGHVRCEERDGFIWVYLPEPGRKEGAAAEEAPIPPAPALPVFSDRYRHFCISVEAPISADHAVISFMDPSHGPFVHRAWWVLARVLFGAHDSVSRVDIVPIPFGFREVTGAKVKERWSANLAGSDTVAVEVDFVLPHVRVGWHRFGKYWLSALVTVTPITADRCSIDQLVAWDVFRWMPFVTTVVKLIFWLFLVQDRRNLEQQAEGIGRIRRFLSIGDADRHARWYQQIKQAYLEARRTGGEFVHPIKGPVALQFRNATSADILRSP
ncbi:MAG: Rieske 2Fe-2S domain-containing protein [Gemmatimonadales bacterium]